MHAMLSGMLILIVPAFLIVSGVALLLLESLFPTAFTRPKRHQDAVLSE